MSASEDSALLHHPSVTENREWLRLLVGAVAVGVGIAAFAWPSATLHVIGFLFGLNLLITGFLRVGLLLFVPGYPVLYRVLGIIFGVLVGILGILCLRNITGSLALLVVIVALGWLLDGLVQIFVALGNAADGGGGWRIASGLLMVLGGIVILVWPGLGLATFLFLGATLLVFVGLAQALSAIFAMRATRSGRAAPVPSAG